MPAKYVIRSEKFVDPPFDDINDAWNGIRILLFTVDLVNLVSHFYVSVIVVIKLSSCG